LEEKKCESGSPLGLYGLSRGGRKTKAGFRCQSSLPGEKSHHWCKRTQFSSIKTVRTKIKCFVHPISLSFGFWYFGHFSCVIFIQVFFRLAHLALQNVNKD
jgi:hypothetical protein